MLIFMMNFVRVLVSGILEAVIAISLVLVYLV